MTKPEIVFCNRCKKDVLYHFEPINHFKQLLMVVFTLGLWLPMWLYMVAGPTKMCNECNGPIWNYE